jgi:hypothetical protein
MKRVGIISIVAVAAFALSGLAASSASAFPPIACYKVDSGKGNWKKTTPEGTECAEKVGELEGEYVLGEPIAKKEKNLWCVRILPAVSKSGTYQSGACETKEENGPYTTVTIAGEPNILPAGTVASPLIATTSSGQSVFGSSGLTEVTSASSLGESSGTEEQGGAFHTSFLGVKNALLGTCTGVGDGSGVVLVLGSFRVRDADLAGKLIVAVLFVLAPQVEFVCGGTAISVTGCVAGNLTPLSELTTLLTITLNRVGNDNEITSYLSETGLPEFCLLLSKAGAGATELSAQQTTQDLTGFKQNGSAVEVLVMPL